MKRRLQKGVEFYRSLTGVRSACVINAYISDILPRFT